MENKEEIKVEEAEKETAAEAGTKEPPKKKRKSESDELKKKIEELERQLAELNDKHLRMAAEYENFRRRSREEKDATYSSALSDTVAGLLPVIDNLERAVSFEDGAKIKEGLSMTLASVGAVFSKLGVEAYCEVGDKFDPNLHSAVLHDEDDTEREGEIVEVFQKGYKKGNKIIRFAMVKTVN